MKARLSLDAKEKSTLNYISSVLASQGSAPTVREISTFLGYKSVSSAQIILSSLKAKGFIEQTHSKSARCLILTDKAWSQVKAATLNTRGKTDDKSVYRIPCIGSVQAGVPNETFEELQGYLRVCVDQLPKPLPRIQMLYALKAQGDSMMGAGILHSDWLIVQSTPESIEGKIVVARLEGTATVKRLQKDHVRGWYLKPENPKYNAIYADENPFDVVGHVISVQRIIDENRL